MATRSIIVFLSLLSAASGASTGEILSKIHAAEEKCSGGKCDDDDVRQYINLMMELGDAHYESDRIKETIEAWQHAMATSVEQFDAMDGQHVAALEKLIDLFISRRNPKMAFPLFYGRVKALEEREESEEQEGMKAFFRASQANNLKRLGETAMMAQNVTVALSAFEKALALQEREEKNPQGFGLNETTTASLRSLLSRMLVQSADKEDKAVFQRALDIARRAAGDIHTYMEKLEAPSIGDANAEQHMEVMIQGSVASASALNAVGGAAEAMGLHEEAMEALQNALGLIEGFADEDDELRKVTEQNLQAMVERDQKRSGGAVASRIRGKRMKAENQAAKKAKKAAEARKDFDKMKEQVDAKKAEKKAEATKVDEKVAEKAEAKAEVVDEKVDPKAEKKAKKAAEAKAKADAKAAAADAKAKAKKEAKAQAMADKAAKAEAKKTSKQKDEV